MAHPFLSFIYPKNKRRYFLTEDTVMCFPENIPMDLITFLQFEGLYCKNSIGTIFSFFNRLVEKGTSVAGGRVHKPEDDPAIKLLIKYLDEFEDNEMDTWRSKLNKQLEELFMSNMEFSDFYPQYLKLISGIDEHPKRQLNYYLFFAHTARCIEEMSTHLIDRYVDLVFDEYSINSSTSDHGRNIIFTLHTWIKENLFTDHRDAMSRLFVLLGKNNLIAIDAIPHVLRRNNEVKELFRYFGMQNLLPDAHIISDNKQRSFKLKRFDVKPHLREFVNHATFDHLGSPSLIGLSLTEISDEELDKKLSDCYIGCLNFLNFVDEYGQTLLPMKYDHHHGVNGKEQMHSLAAYGRECYHIFTKSGWQIDRRGYLERRGYYDLRKVSLSVFYLQSFDNLRRWRRFEYNSDKKEVLTVDIPLIGELDVLIMDENFRNELERFYNGGRKTKEELNKRFRKEKSSYQNDVEDDDSSSEDNGLLF